MKKIILLLAVICLTVVSGFSQTITEERTIDSFNGIDVCCGINVYITEGTSTTIKVEVNKEELLSHVKTKVSGGVLNISINNSGIGGLFKSLKNNKIAVYVSASNLTSIDASSGSKAQSVNNLQATDIKLSASSGSAIDLALKASSISAEASSGARVAVSGSAVRAKMSASSGGDVDMQKTSVEKAEAAASSGGAVKITVANEINGEASSGGSVAYYGQPKTVIKNESSGGSVKNK